jgi:hypothetical protein
MRCYDGDDLHGELTGACRNSTLIVLFVLSYSTCSVLATCSKMKLFEVNLRLKSYPHEHFRGQNPLGAIVYPVTSSHSRRA